MSDLQFAKIVASPSSDSWAQVYSAGKLFAVLSLHKKNDEEETLLSAIGKEVLTTLEQEFFTLEQKNLTTIKQAILVTAKKIPQDVLASFIVAYVADNLMYLFVKGNALGQLRREEKLGRVTDAESGDEDVATYSGFLQDNDIVILSTQEFSNIISHHALLTALKSNVPEEIAENIAPVIQGKEEGRAAAIILLYKDAGVTALPEETDEPDNEEKEEGVEEEVIMPQPPFIPELEHKKRKISFPSLPLGFAKNKLRLSHTKKLFLTIAVVLILVLFGSIYLSSKKQNTANSQALFDDIYPKAEKQYEQGVSLLDLNKNLATDSLNSAKKLLSDNENKFPQGSNQRQQVDALLKKVNDALSGNTSTGTLDKSKIAIIVQNGSGQAGVAGKASDFLKSLGYNVTGTGNADNSNYTGVTIQLKSSASAYADVLRKDLSQKYTVGNVSTDLPASSSQDALIIIGK